MAPPAPLSVRLRVTCLISAFTVLALWSLTAQISALDRLAQRSSRHDVHAAAVVQRTPRRAISAEAAFDWAELMPRRDLLDLNTLVTACTTKAFNESIIPWDFGSTARVITPSDVDVLDVLRQCPDVDIYLPSGIRSHGYCEDGVAYAKFLQSRLLPAWVMEIKMFDPAANRHLTYHDLCPHTPIIIFNHYFDGIHEDPRWPRTKPIYIMPNLDMHELEAKHYWLADVVLCKTEICDRYVKKWYRQEGNPRNATVLYTRHTTSDVALHARTVLGDDAIAFKNFDKPVFVHTAGTSIQKGTTRVLDCWLERPDLPLVNIYMAQDLYDGEFKDRYEDRIVTSPNIRFRTGKFDPTTFGKIIAEAAIFLCTSIQEGYGHYINQARAAGGLVLTPNVPPMSELITESTGVRIQATSHGSEQMFLSGESKHPLGLRNVTGFIADFGGHEVCAAVDRVLNELSSAQRRRRAERARQQYLHDTVFFARAMQQLRELARRHLSASAPTAAARQQLRTQ